MLYKMVLTFASVDEILNCENWLTSKWKGVAGTEHIIAQEFGCQPRTRETFLLFLSTPVHYLRLISPAVQEPRAYHLQKQISLRDLAASVWFAVPLSAICGISGGSLRERAPHIRLSLCGLLRIIYQIQHIREPLLKDKILFDISFDPDSYFSLSTIPLAIISKYFWRYLRLYFWFYCYSKNLGKNTRDSISKFKRVLQLV